MINCVNFRKKLQHKQLMKLQRNWFSLLSYGDNELHGRYKNGFSKNEKKNMYVKIINSLSKNKRHEFCEYLDIYSQYLKIISVKPFLYYFFFNFINQMFIYFISLSNYLEKLQRQTFLFIQREMLNAVTS